MEDNDDLAQLEELLSAHQDDEPRLKAFTMEEIDLFQTSSSEPLEPQSNKNEKHSTMHQDTDSSEDEEGKNYTEKKYSDYGSEVKMILDQKDHEQMDKRLDFETRLRQTNIDVKVAKSRSFLVKKPDFDLENSSKNLFCPPENKTNIKVDIYTDPIFGIRIVKPLLSSAVLFDRMQGREAINMLRVKRHVEHGDLSKDWVIAGVIVRKSAVKQSQKGNQFSIWTLSDLRDDLKTVSMFLFRKAYSNLWKTTEGTVVAVLNPNVLDRSQNSNDQACLSVENPERVMIIGQSKDLGICKSKKKNGDPCSAFVNLTQCEHCIYHVKQEYNKFSKRQELQSSTMGKGLVSLQNKVLGKSTVIYGGKAYTALPKGNTKKVAERDQNRLMSLTDYYKSEGDRLMMNRAPSGSGLMNKTSGILHSPTAPRVNDAERLNKLTTSPASSQKLASPKTPKSSLADKVANSPTLGKGFGLKGSGLIDLNTPYRQKASEKAKANALRLIKKNGGIPKSDPHNTRGTEAGKKRALEKLNDSKQSENHSKRPKTEEENPSIKPKAIMSERFRKILEASSAHENLIKEHEDDEQEKYFSKQEKKEAMEEKMLNTFKLPCKAVRCVKCKYTSFSAAQLCKDERHPLKILDTVKRFFKCADCNNRTVSLEVIPLHSCNNCKGSRWVKAPMLREKKVTLNEGLSIRGEEETFIGGQIGAGKNINLLVPE